MKSTYVGQALTNLKKSEGYTNEQISWDMPLDPTMISKMCHNKRKMQPDIATMSMDAFDNEPYTLEITREFTSGATAPRINGDGIDFTNPLAVLYKAKAETEEALRTIDMEMFLKRPDLATEDELKRIDIFIKEFKESSWWIDNLIALMTEAYNRSGKKLNGEVTRKWKAGAYLK